MRPIIEFRDNKTIRRPLENEPYFASKRLEKQNCFLVIDDSKLELYAPLLHIMIAQSLDYFSSRKNDEVNSILLCLDEYASLGKLEITPALRKFRKKKVRIMMLTQSMADIDLIYGKEERMAMMNNFRFKVVLGASDTETQEYFAKLIGYKDSKKYSRTTSHTSYSKTEADDKTWIVEPSDLDHLKHDLLLLSPEGCLKLKKNFYFK